MYWDFVFAAAKFQTTLHWLAFVNAAPMIMNQARVKVHAASPATLIPRLHMREPQSYSICLQNFPACNLKVKPLSLH